MSTTETPTEPEVEPEAPAPKPAPKNVHEAIRRVMMELPGIPKMAGAEHRERSGVEPDADDGKGVKYAYRSIEQITGDAQELFGLYGCVWQPKVLESNVVEIQVNNRPWTDTYLTVTYYVVGPAGAETIIPTTKHFAEDGSYVEAPDVNAWYMKGDYTIVGPLKVVGRDNSDKGFNKAMTQAFKQGLLQVLCIGDPKDEGEHEKAERDSSSGQSRGRVAPPEGWPLAAPDLVANLKRQIESLPQTHQDELRKEWREVETPINGENGEPVKGLDKLDPEFFRMIHFPIADRLVQRHLLAVHDEKGGGTELPPPNALDAVNGNPDTAQPPVDPEMMTAKQELASAILAHEQVERLTLQSRLRGLFGPSEDMTDIEDVRQAIAIARAYPDNPPEAQEPPPAAPGSPEPAGEAPPPAPADSGSLEGLIPTGTPDEVVDQVVIEVGSMKVPELKDELRKLGKPVTGDKSVMGQRLIVARIAAWHLEQTTGS